MSDDPIIDEIRQIRDQMAAEAGYDVQAYFAALRMGSTTPEEQLVVRECAAGGSLHLRDAAPLR